MNLILQALKSLQDKNVNEAKQSKEDEKDVAIMVSIIEDLSKVHAKVIPTYATVKWSNDKTKGEIRKIILDSMKKVHVILKRVNKI